MNLFLSVCRIFSTELSSAVLKRLDLVNRNIFLFFPDPASALHAKKAGELGKVRLIEYREMLN
jgi:hypothetical protein